jgi:hypothetical protein
MTRPGAGANVTTRRRRPYVRTKIDPAPGAALEEIALGEYRRTLQSRLSAAIRPADDEGEQPLLPVLDDMAGIGTTDVTPFLTVKPCQPTLRSLKGSISPIRGLRHR